METNFRKSSWRMSKDEVRATEASPPAYESETALGYRGELMGSECMVYFEFDSVGLARAAYMIDNPDDARDIEDYNRLKSLLTKKYGEPKEAGMVPSVNRRFPVPSVIGIVMSSISSTRSALKSV